MAVESVADDDESSKLWLVVSVNVIDKLAYFAQNLIPLFVVHVPGNLVIFFFARTKLRQFHFASVQIVGHCFNNGVGLLVQRRNPQHQGVFNVEAVDQFFLQLLLVGKKSNFVQVGHPCHQFNLGRLVAQPSFQHRRIEQRMVADKLADGLECFDVTLFLSGIQNTFL